MPLAEDFGKRRDWGGMTFNRKASLGIPMCACKVYGYAEIPEDWNCDSLMKDVAIPELALSTITR